MTRFDAADPAGRRKLVAEAIRAHRRRDSPYLTLEADPEAVEDGAPPWVQFSDGEGVLNLDCTAEEFDRLAALLEEFPAFTVRERTEPEGAEGINVRVGALADAGRIGGFVDRAFLEAYGLGDGYRLWVAEL